jgi:hypothetical protein
VERGQRDNLGVNARRIRTADIFEMPERRLSCGWADRRKDDNSRAEAQPICSSHNIMSRDHRLLLELNSSYREIANGRSNRLPQSQGFQYLRAVSFEDCSRYCRCWVALRLLYSRLRMGLFAV